MKNTDVPLTERNWAVLGLLRFLLAAIIVTGHVFFATKYQSWHWMFDGFTTVCSFFLISGFSIAASISFRPDGYYKRRLRRIYPLIITSIIITIAILVLVIRGLPYTHTSIPPLQDVFFTCLLLNGLLVATPLIFGPLWSLNCEVFYYLVAPVLVRLSTKVILFFTFLSLLFFLSQLSHKTFYNYAQSSHGIAMISLFWIWLLGFLAWRHPLNLWLMVAVIGGGSLVFYSRALSDGILALPMYMIVAICVTALPKIRLPIKWVGLCNYLGELSYPLYVIHFAVVLLSWRVMAGRSLVLAGLFIWVISLTLSIAAYHGIDRRFRRPRRVRAE